MLQQLRDFISYFENSALADNIRENDVLFPISNAAKYLENGYFDAKMLLICAAGLNMAMFHALSAKDLPRWDNDTRLPLRARLAGGLSILLWVAVVACGRWIGFTMEVR